ncbi:MAG: hypothetical protein L0Y71_01775 [Gemmataceae bacterium]|nr:hypothetical protein [Gemmataceae bacterium]
MNYRFVRDDWLPRFPLEERYGHFSAEIITSPWDLAKANTCAASSWGALHFDRRTRRRSRALVVLLIRDIPVVTCDEFIAARAALRYTPRTRAWVMESSDRRNTLIVEIINAVPVVVVRQGTPPIDPELVRRLLREEGF